MKKLYISLLLFVLLLGFKNINAQSYVDFYVNYSGGCGPDTVSFVNNTYLDPDTVGPINYEWFINGELYSTLQNPPDTLMPGGYHSISLWVWDQAGFSGDAYQDIYIPGLGSIKSIPKEICPGEEVQFHLEGNSDWIIWKFPDGSTSTEWEETYVFSTADTFLVKAIGSTYECGLDSVSAEIITDNSAKPRAEIWVNGSWFCPNDEVNFSSPDAASHTWTFTKDTVTDTIYGQNIYYAFADTGEYTVTLTTTNGCGNDSTITEYVFIGTDATPNSWFIVDYGDNPQCPNYEIKFEAEGFGEYEWDFGDGSYAYDRIVYNTYSEPGLYTVQLIVRNGCNQSDTTIQEVSIDYTMENAPGVQINFKDKDNGLEYLNICPNTDVEFESEIWNVVEDDDIDITWYVDSIPVSHSENLIHHFNEHGSYEIKLVVINKCLAIDSALKYVYVDTLMMPVTQLNAAPYDICPGEEVFFWDDGNHDDWNTDYIQNLIYNFEFGDGESTNNIIDETVEFPPVLVKHQYAAGTFDFIFTATNSCGNTDTLQGTIIVNDDPERDPFYYVGNSTVGDGEEGQMEDWSNTVVNGHKFDIPIDLSSWNYYGDMDSMVYVFLWYGNIDPNGDPGPPDGILSAHAPDTVSAYVPYNVIEPSVGIAVVWYCDSGNLDSDPSVYTLPTTTAFEEIQSFPLEKNGYTDLRTYPDISGPLTLDGMMWDGFCKTGESKLRSRWYYQADAGYYVALGIWEENDSLLYYDISYGSDRWNTSSFVSYGTLEELSEGYLYFNQLEGDMCIDPINFEYSYFLDEATDELTLTNMSDTCSSRINLLTTKPFMRDDDNDMEYDYEKDKTGCPGDSVELYIAGGISYQWFLEDGTETTEAYFYHAYADTGTYKELVVATNACGRVDSIYTYVHIGNTNVPEAYWYADQWDARRMEPIQFWYEEHDDDLDNNNYVWDFGDGSTSTEKNPSHYYVNEGDYNVTLTVFNGCGSSEQTQTVWIKKELASCIAKFTYSITDKTVTFNNNSVGEISSFYWDFGDGKVSELEDPVHTYDNYGVYEVLLIVHDSVTQCSDEISIMLTLGTVDCFANFIYQINETNQNVIFTDESLGDITSWFWEFGDGTISSDSMPVHNYPNQGVYLVCLTVSNNATGCISSLCKEITVGNVDIYADFNHYIESGTGKVTFSDNSDGNPTNWYWEFGDGTWDTIPNTMHTYSESGTYPVCLSIYNENIDAFDDICKDITVLTSMEDTITKAKFNYMVDPDNYTVLFRDASTGNINSWYWTFGNGKYATGDSVSHTYTAPGFYNVCLTVFNATTGERSDLCKTIQVGSLGCNISADFGYYINPNTNEVSFNDKSTGSVNAWFWDFADGQTSSQKSPKHKFNQPGLYLVSLAIRDTVNNCNDYYADFVQVGVAECIADFAYTVTDTINKTVKFTNNSVGNIEDYFWYFDDGSFDTIPNVEHSYDNAGMYSASLTVIGSNGSCVDNKIKEIQVGTVNCDASFTAYIDSTSNTAYFTNSSYGSATDYYWLFGDGSYHIGANPSHKYPAAGYYTVSLNTYNSQNACFDYYEDVILIGNSGSDVEADFIYQSDFTNGTVKFFNKSLGENLTFTWDFGDGVTSSEKDPSHMYSEGGYQFVCLTAKNTVTDAIKTTCKLVQTSNDDNNCLAQFKYDIDTNTNQVQFIDLSYGNPDTYTWTFGDGNTATSTDPLHEYDNKDFYLVELYIYNTTTQCESKSVEYINVGVKNDSIQAAFTYELDTSAIGKPVGKPIDIWGTGHGGGSKLSWSFGDETKIESKAVNTTTLRPRHEYATGGKYNVCLTISDDLINQSDTYCKDVFIPYETFISETICQGNEYSFFGTPLTAAGDYDHTTTAIDGADSTIYLTLSVNPSPDQPVVTTDNYTLSTTAATSYQWYLDGEPISGATEQTYTVSADGNYHVVVTNSYGCYSEPSETNIYSLISSEICSGTSYSFFEDELTEAGTYDTTLTTTLDIDSTIVLDLTVNPSPDKPTITVDGYTLTATAASSYQWYLDGDPINGATDQTYSATASGDYTVIVFNEFGCPSVSSDAQTVVGSSIDNIDELSVNIYPNPMQAYTKINYNLLKTGEINISVIDASGNQIATLVSTFKPAGDHQIIWRDPGLASGIYYVVFKTDNQVISKKLMIQK